jgi:hypothetical protein
MIHSSEISVGRVPLSLRKSDGHGYLLTPSHDFQMISVFPIHTNRRELP